MWSLFNKNKRNTTTSEEFNLDMNNIPKHIGIIMDGNGRWARERNLPRTMGHRAAVENIREIVRECSALRVQVLTLYAFSTENWIRPAEEVNALMSLLVEYLKKEFNELHSNNVVINPIGDISKLPSVCQRELENSSKKTKNNTGLILNLALNYGSRAEITRAFKIIHGDILSGKLSANDIDEKTISDYLYTGGMPDPDLIIRPSGEKRLSNFMLWQSAYSEIWTSDIKWPDFKKEHLHKAILDYQNRDRRFGGIK